jgi:hypothetical protein
MENKIIVKAFSPIILIFIVINSILISGNSLISRWNMDQDVMIIGNLILFLATAISFYLYQRSLRNNQVQSFLRMIYSGMIVKMMICLFTALIYISSAGKSVNKEAIFGCMFLYFLYTFSEVAIILKLSKQNKNA